jgi:hypothetical protein
LGYLQNISTAKMRMDEEHLTGAPAEPSPPASGHDRHCFIVMPFGRDASEQKWFRGWYEVVIKPAVLEAGYDPKLAAAEEQPGAINDEIRAHLALDPMVVVDLAGAEPEDDPNPNVMYELGIRHALGLPLVMMAWKGQRLPFDVSNQRIIMEERDLVDLETNRKRLVTFIRAAEQGRFYRPMDAVGRMATIAAASESLGEDSLLRALAQEVRELRTSIAHSTPPRAKKRRDDQVPTVKHLIQGKVYRKELYPYFQQIGGDAASWPKILRIRIPSDELETMREGSLEDWKQYISARWEEIRSGAAVPSASLSFLDEALLDAAKGYLPPQPWPSGVHKELAEKLGLTPSQASKYIAELIRRGDYMEQVDGELIPGGDSV